MWTVQTQPYVTFRPWDTVCLDHTGLLYLIFFFIIVFSYFVFACSPVKWLFQFNTKFRLDTNDHVLGLNFCICFFSEKLNVSTRYLKSSLLLWGTFNDFTFHFLASMRPNIFLGVSEGSAQYKKWYYELMIDQVDHFVTSEPSHLRVGWANSKGYAPYPGGGEGWGGNGVGDDLYSYGFDGLHLWSGELEKGISVIMCVWLRSLRANISQLSSNPGLWPGHI